MKGRHVFSLAALALLLTAAALAQTTQIASDWRFPSPDIEGRYDEKLKATVYDLGEGYTAQRVKTEAGEFVVVTIPPGKHKELRDAPASEVAFIVAASALNLSADLGRLFLKPEGREFRFLTLNGNTAGVTVARDRKTAAVRILPVEMQ